MLYRIFSLIGLICCVQLLSAQCDRSDYREIIRLAQEDLQTRTYQRAINRLLDARDICPDKKKAVNALIKQVFEQIEGEKLAAQVAQERADSALGVANRVLDQMHFYKGKLGLTMKNIGEEDEPIYKYGFIDQDGKEAIPFEFDEVVPFSLQDGYARVKIKDTQHLLDTRGEKYRLVERIEDLSWGVESLHVLPQGGKTLPDDIGKHKRLKIILAHGQYRVPGPVRRLPASIGQLTDLQDLYLHFNTLSDLPPEIGKLVKLRRLVLSQNAISSLPAEFGRLNSLRILDLSNNQLSVLPPEMAELRSLHTFDLRSNQLAELPAWIGELTSLRALKLSQNVLQSLPTLEKLQGLRNLSLSNNEFQQIPDEISKCLALESLDLSNNRFHRLPKGIDQLPNLQQLNIRGNPITYLSEFVCTLPVFSFHPRLDSLVCQTCKDIEIESVGDQVLAAYYRQADVKKEYGKTYEYITRLTQRDPSNSRYWHSLSWFACFVGEYEAGIEAAKMSLLLEPRNVRVSTNLALNYLLGGQYEKAHGIYAAWKDKEFYRDAGAKEIFLTDIEDLKAAGINHPDMEKIVSFLNK